MEFKLRNMKNGRHKKFIVIPEHRIVRGEMNQEGLWEEFETVCTNDEMECLPFFMINGNDYFGKPAIIKAFAKCDPKDEWSEKIGVDIASAKLDMKEHLRKARKCERLLVTMNSLMRKTEDICNKHMKKAKAIRDDLEKYYGGIYR